MYSSTGDGKTMIKIGGGNNKSKVEPLYCVPIQTTATLNIQLIMPRGASTSISTSTSANQSRQAGLAAPTRGPGTSYVTPTKVNIVAEVPPRRSTMDAGYADDASSSLGTQTDFAAPPYQNEPQSTASRPVSFAAETLTSASSTLMSDTLDSSSQIGFAGSTSRMESFNSASQSYLPDSASQTEFSDSASHCGSSVLSSYSSSSSNGNKDADDEERSEYRVFTDVDAGDDGGEAAAKLAQMSIGGGGDGSSEWKGVDDDDDDSEDGWEELGKPALPSTFNVIEWDFPMEKSSKQNAYNRVIIIKDKEMILMLKATCSTQKSGKDSRMLSLMVEIAENCSKRLRKMKTLPNLCAKHMDTLPLSDGRTTKEHLKEMSQTLGDNIGIQEVAYRFQPPGDVYIGTFVQGTVLAKRNYAIGRAGVVAVLFKKSKYATVEAFSEQLCEHIALAQPTTLGHLSDADLKKLNRRGTTRIKHLQKDQLLIQNFIFDPTIIVAEAARRSFVRIDDFLLFK